MQNEKTSADTRATTAPEGGAGHYERYPIAGDDGKVERRFTVGKFIPAVARMMSDEEPQR